MAYFESITAGRGGLDSFNQALNSQRYANLVLNESMSNFANTIANAGSLFDNAKIREETLKYQRMRDLANDKKQAEAFELQKRQAEQSMDFAKRQQVLNEKEHEQNLELKGLQAEALRQENRLNEKQYQWLKRIMSSAKAKVGNNDKTPTKPNPLNTQSTPIPTKPNIPKTMTKEEFKAFVTNPFFRY
ncbi:hypothetical protein E5D87_01185 [Helicobacter pylori]|nr:hypothetical protein E5D87_01185 [Helicobacter pylori]